MKEFCSHEGITVAEKLRSRPLLCNARSYQQGRLVSIVLGSGGSRPSDKGGGGHPDPEIRGGPGLKKIFFSALRASFWSKNKGGGRAPQAPPLDPPLLGNRIQVSTGISTVKLRSAFIERGPVTVIYLFLLTIPITRLYSLWNLRCYL